MKIKHWHWLLRYSIISIQFYYAYINPFQLSNSAIISLLLSRLASPDLLNRINRIFVHQSTLNVFENSKISNSLDFFKSYSKSPGRSFNSFSQNIANLTAIQLNWHDVSLNQLKLDWFLEAANNFNNRWLPKNSMYSKTHSYLL